ncbi:MAG: hypothetical protein NXH70_02050 [Hyphomonas sp.]|nr:hypothetical protein [Hyphomonas sp.]
MSLQSSDLQIATINGPYYEDGSGPAYLIDAIPGSQTIWVKESQHGDKWLVFDKTEIDGLIHRLQKAKELLNFPVYGDVATA